MASVAWWLIEKDRLASILIVIIEVDEGLLRAVFRFILVKLRLGAR